MSIIEVKSEDGKQSKKFVNVDKLVEALTKHSIPFEPVIENVDFSGKKFYISEEEQNAADASAEDALSAILEKVNKAKANGEALNTGDLLREYDELSHDYNSYPTAGTFKNCKFDGAKFLNSVDIKAYNCSFQEAYFEGEDVTLKGKDNSFERMVLNGRMNLKLDVENSSFKGADLYKVHVSGKMVGGYMPLVSRTWLGQYNELTMKDVDFGKDEVDPDYFFSKHLTLINPKMNPTTRKQVEEMFPGRIRSDEVVKPKQNTMDM